MDPADLDSPRRKLSNGGPLGLGIVATLLVRWEIYFSCASTDRQSSRTPNGIQ